MSWEMIFAALTVFGAGVVRGYTGFGFAMICALTLALVFSPAMVTPVLLTLEIISSIWLFIKVRHEVDWKSLRLICLGGALALPLGTLALVSLPVNAMRICISLIIAILCILLLKEKLRAMSEGPLVTTAVGAGSGFLTGLSALGGPPVVLFYFSSDRPVAVSRASMIAFFFLIDILAIIVCYFYGLMTPEVPKMTALLFIPMALGIWAGAQMFKHLRNEAAFKRHVVTILLVTSIASFIKFTLLG